MTSKTRSLANLINNTGDVKAANLDNASAGVTVYATKENLPATGMTSGDQAYVSNTSRLYISNGSGWYNVALINATPSLTIDPTGAIVLSTDGTPTTITLTATDSDNAVAGLTFSVDSDGSFAGLGTLTQDSSVFTITPLSEDSATTSSTTLTFKASDGISFGSGTRGLSLTFSITNSNYTRLLLQADASATDAQVDASTNAHAIGGTTGTSSAFSPYHPGKYSPYFSTNQQRIYTSGTSADFYINTNDFSYEGWVFVPIGTSLPTYSRFCGLGPFYNNAASLGIMLYDGDATVTGSMTTYWGSGGANAARTLISSTAFELGKWNHMAVCRSGDAIALFYNGTRIAYNGTYGTNTAIGANTYAYVGHTGNGNEGFQGYFHDVRFVNGSSAYDATQSTITIPTASLTEITNTKLLLGGSPEIADKSTNAQTLVVSVDSNKRFGPYDSLAAYTKADHGGSMHFSGSGQWLTTANGTIPNSLGTGATYTIEAWAYIEDLSSQRNLIGAGTGANTSSLAVTSAGQLYLQIYSASANRILYTTAAANPVKTNCWSHIAMTYGSGTYKFFIDGKKIGERASDGYGFYNGTNLGTMYIGRYAYSNSNPWFGYMSDFRIVDSLVYTDDFTPPTSPLTAIANTEILTCTNKSDIWDAGVGTVLTKAGNTTASNTQRKFATSSAMYFDGTDDYITVADSTDFDFGTSDFTMEGWYYATDVSGDRYILNFTTSAGNGHFGVNFYNGGWRVGLFNGSLITGTTGIEVNAWHHFAWVRQSGTMKFYIDGTQVGSNVSYSSALDCSGTFRIGTYATTPTYGEFLGYVQDVRITKGLARYTSNFTPPTSEFAG